MVDTVYIDKVTRIYDTLCRVQQGYEHNDQEMYELAIARKWVDSKGLTQWGLWEKIRLSDIIKEYKGVRGL